MSNCAYGAAPGEFHERKSVYYRNKLPDDSTSREIDLYRDFLLGIKRLTSDLLHQVEVYKEDPEAYSAGNTQSFQRKLKTLAKTVEAGLVYTEKANLLAYGYEKACVTKNVSIVSQMEDIEKCLRSFYSLFPEATFEDLSRRFAVYTEDLDFCDFLTVTCDSLKVELYQQALSCADYKRTVKSLEELLPDFPATLKQFRASELLERARTAYRQAQADLRKSLEQLERRQSQKYAIVSEMLDQAVAFNSYKVDVLYLHVLHYYQRIASLFEVTPEEKS